MMNTLHMPASLRQSILNVLAYFDLFDYPLTRAEILSFLGRPVQPGAFEQTLEELLAEHRVFPCRQFYALRNQTALATRRIAGNRRAQPLLQTGRRISRLLYQVPYVRAIAISGSLSKTFAAADADIDYFIITGANRLWIARTLMHLVKKFSYLLGRQHWYCMNYYIDEEALEIEEKNIFTAIELLTLLPVCGQDRFGEFFVRNGWAAGFYPNYHPRSAVPEDPCSDSFGKRLLEWLFRGGIGDRLDDYLMRVTTRRWKSKEALQKRSAKGTRMGLCTGKHFSKPNPRFFQQQVLAAYEDRLKKLMPESRGHLF
jgi:hypothetical protein